MTLSPETLVVVVFVFLKLFISGENLKFAWQLYPHLLFLSWFPSLTLPLPQQVLLSLAGNGIECGSFSHLGELLRFPRSLLCIQEASMFLNFFFSSVFVFYYGGGSLSQESGRAEGTFFFLSTVCIEIELL